MRISFTPGAALATKSNVRASGPILAMSGIFSWRLRYSLSESSVFIDIANRPGRTSRSLNAVGPVSKKSARLPLASTSATSVRLPCCAARSASEAAMVVLPTPPLPVTNSSLRSRRSVMAEGPDRAGGQPPKPMRRSSCGEPIST